MHAAYLLLYLVLLIYCRHQNVKCFDDDEQYLVPLPPPSVPDKSDVVVTRDIVRRHQNISRFAKRFPVSLPDYQAVILIGSNSGEAMKIKYYGFQFPYVTETALGWSHVGSSRLEDPSVTSKTSGAGSGSSKGKNLSRESVPINNDSSS